jgi:hypothetical protein
MEIFDEITIPYTRTTDCGGGNLLIIPTGDSGPSVLPVPQIASILASSALMFRR